MRERRIKKPSTLSLFWAFFAMNLTWGFLLKIARSSFSPFWQLIRAWSFSVCVRACVRMRWGEISTIYFCRIVHECMHASLAPQLIFV